MSAIELDHLPTRPAAAARSPSHASSRSAGSVKRTPSPPGLPDSFDVGLSAVARTPSAAESTFGVVRGSEQATTELEPVDRGKGAVMFLINSFMLEVGGDGRRARR